MSTATTMTEATYWTTLFGERTAAQLVAEFDLAADGGSGLDEWVLQSEIVAAEQGADLVYDDIPQAWRDRVAAELRAAMSPGGVDLSDLYVSAAQQWAGSALGCWAIRWIAGGVLGQRTTSERCYALHEMALLLAARVASDGPPPTAAEILEMASTATALALDHGRQIGASVPPAAIECVTVGGAPLALVWGSGRSRLRLGLYSGRPTTSPISAEVTVCRWTTAADIAGGVATGIEREAIAADLAPPPWA